MKFLSSVHSIILVLFIAYYSSLITDEIIALKIGSSLACVIGILNIIREAKLSTFKITPVSVLILPVIVSFGIGAYFDAITLEKNGFLVLVNHTISPSNIFNAWLLALFGFYFFIIGLQAKINAEKFKSSFSAPNEYYLSVFHLLFIYVVGLIAIIASSYIAFLGSMASLLRLLPHSCILTLVFLNLNKSSINKKNYYNLIVLLTGILFVVNVPQLSKISLIYSVVPLLIYHIAQGAIKLKTWLVFASFFLVVYLFIFPFVGAARLVFAQSKENVTTDAIAELLDNNKYQEINKDQNELLQVEQTDVVISRLSELNAIGFVIREVENSGYLNGAGLYYLPYALIPRILWPDKPIIVQGEKFASSLGIEKVSIGMSAMGELYWNFGIISVAIGMFLLGLFWAFFVNIFSSLDSLFLKSFGLWILVVNITSLSEWGASIIGVITIIIVFKILQISTNKLNLPV